MKDPGYDQKNEERTCYLFGAGDYGKMPPPECSGDGVVIAVDAGYEQLTRWGLRPELAVGDFDSLGRVPAEVPVVRHPVEKDDTDMLLAVREGLSRGCKRFLIYGGLGKRLDHAIGNLQLLAWLARRGCAAFLLGEGTAVTAIHNGTMVFSPGHQGTLSLFAWGERAEGVTLTGLYYPLEDGTLRCDLPLGVSNKFLGRESVVQVREGTVLAVWTQPELLPDLRWDVSRA